MSILQMIGSEGHFELDYDGALETVMLVATPLRDLNAVGRETIHVPHREFLLYRHTRDGAIYLEKDAYPPTRFWP